jgi:tetratricopeptide (TPR) repeat protein
MFRLPFAMRAAARAGISSHVALALGAAIGAAALTGPAFAQGMEQRTQQQLDREQQQQGRPQQGRRQQQQGEALSRNFSPLYQAVANATNTTADYAGAKSQVPAMIAAIDTQYDRFFAGNITFQLGAKSSDLALQRRGLELMLESGRGTPADIGLFRYYLGGVFFDQQDYEGARRELQASVAAGFQGNFEQQQDPWGLIASSYFRQNRFQEGLAFLKNTVTQRAAAGQPVRDAWLGSGLTIATEQGLAAESGEWAALLVQMRPGAASWAQAIQIVGTLAQDDPKTMLDVMRLMSLAGAMRDRNDYVRYIEAADPRIMSNEVARVLDAGVQAGAFTTGEQYYLETKRVVDDNAARDRSEAPALAAEARGAASTARSAQNAGDVYLSLGSFAEAEAMYALGLQKPGADRDLLLTRIGIAQVHQGKYAEAKATLAQVSGTRAALARLWSAYADGRA